MSKNNRKRRRQNNVPQQNAAAITQSIDERAEFRLDELRKTFSEVAATIPPAQQPRKFRSRTFIIGPFTVSVSGEDDALENEFWPRQEGEELLLLFGDAALEARVSKQRSSALPSGVMSVIPARAAAPVFAGDLVTPVQTSAPEEPFDPRRRYPKERIEQSRRYALDPQDAALAGLGVSMQSLAADVGLGELAIADDDYGPV